MEVLSIKLKQSNVIQAEISFKLNGFCSFVYHYQPIPLKSQQCVKNILVNCTAMSAKTSLSSIFRLLGLSLTYIVM